MHFAWFGCGERSTNYAYHAGKVLRHFCGQHSPQEMRSQKMRSVCRADREKCARCVGLIAKNAIGGRADREKCAWCVGLIGKNALGGRAAC